MKPNKIADELIRAYFRLGKQFNIFSDTLDISEFFRYTLCLALNLKTTSTYIGYDYEADIIVTEFNNVLKNNKFPRITTKKYRQGILEACIHAMELSRKNLKTKEAI